MGSGAASHRRRLAHLGAALAPPAPPAHPLAAGAASAGAGGVTTTMDDAMKEFEREGVVVLRGYFSEDELAAMTDPVDALQGAPDSPLQTNPG